jgi:hypothetical protein
VSGGYIHIRNPTTIPNSATLEAYRVSQPETLQGDPRQTAVRSASYASASLMSPASSAYPINSMMQSQAQQQQQQQQQQTVAYQPRLHTYQSPYAARPMSAASTGMPGWGGGGGFGGGGSQYQVATAGAGYEGVTTLRGYAATQYQAQQQRGLPITAAPSTSSYSAPYAPTYGFINL